MFVFKAAGSSSGRMQVSGTCHLGSNPSPAALKRNEEIGFLAHLVRLLTEAVHLVIISVQLFLKCLARSCEVTSSHFSPSPAALKRNEEIGFLALRYFLDFYTVLH
jgi:ribosomal protein L34